MVVVTHEMSFARDVCQEVVFMDEVQVVEQSTPDKFFSNPRTDRAKRFLTRYE